MPVDVPEIPLWPFVLAFGLAGYVAGRLIEWLITLLI